LSLFPWLARGYHRASLWQWIIQGSKRMGKVLGFRCLALAVALSMVGCVTTEGGGSAPLKVLKMAPPRYPEELKKAGVEGEVEVGFSIQASGEVTNVSVARSTNPQLAQVVQLAVEQWRFERWTPSAGNPAPRRVIKRFLFRLDTPPTCDSGAGQGCPEWGDGEFAALMRQSCAKISQEYFAFRRANLDLPMRDMPTFKTVRGGLLLSMLDGATDEQAAAQLGERMDAVLPRVVQRCRSEPNATFGVVLREELERKPVDRSFF